MKLEYKVCSLEHAKKLNDLGVKQESLFYWKVCFIDEDAKLLNVTPRIIFSKTGQRPDINNEYLGFMKYISAFTVEELGELLPAMIKSYKLFKDNWECVYEILEIGVREKTEANARAKMLIHLIENKLITIEQINKETICHQA